jgi:hypothetical protein
MRKILYSISILSCACFLAKRTFIHLHISGKASQSGADMATLWCIYNHPSEMEELGDIKKPDYRVALGHLKVLSITPGMINVHIIVLTQYTLMAHHRD